MDLPPGLAIIHQPARLKIMGLLYKRRDVGFVAAREATGLTDGNLATHIKKLADDGLVDARRVLQRDGFELRYTITKDGHRRFAAYLRWLRAMLADIEPGPAANLQRADNAGPSSDQSSGPVEI